MPVKVDPYRDALANVVKDIENAYKLKSYNINGGSYLNADITDLIKAITEDIKSLDNREIQSRNATAGMATALLPYISRRCTFYKKKRLDFSHYPALDKIAPVLLTFTKADEIKADYLSEVNKIVQLLSEIDMRFINFRGGLGYRYLRIFVILVYYGNFSNAACVADFIINQFVVRSGK